MNVIPVLNANDTVSEPYAPDEGNYVSITCADTWSRKRGRERGSGRGKEERGREREGRKREGERKEDEGGRGKEREGEGRKMREGEGRRGREREGNGGNEEAVYVH